MENELKDLVEQLGSAIDESIAGSDRIATIVHEMERAGYDLTLVLEATMRLSAKIKAEEGEGEFDSTLPALMPTGHMNLTPEDHDFLQAMKVAL